MERSSLPKLKQGNCEQPHSRSNNIITKKSRLLDSCEDCREIKPLENHIVKSSDNIQQESSVSADTVVGTSFHSATLKLRTNNPPTLANLATLAHQHAGLLQGNNAGPSTTKHQSETGTALKKNDCDKPGLVEAVVVDDSEKPKVDFNRINELDNFCNQNHHQSFPFSRTFTNHLLKPQADTFKKVKEGKEPVAGPSNIKRKKKLPVMDDTPYEDAKSVARCILENSLNKVDSNKGIKTKAGQIIQYVPEENSTAKAVTNACELDFDLSMSDDDIAGNIAEAAAETNKGDNIVTDSNTPATFGNLPGQVDVAAPTINIDNPSNSESTEPESQQQTDTEVAHASREALFDPNSQVDLLEDYELPELFPDVPSVNNNGNIVLIGVNLDLSEQDEAALTATGHGFPDWLLQIMLGTNINNEENEQHDGPDFYCQGDGLGVHPSVIAVDIDEEDDDGISTESTSVASGNSVESSHSELEDEATPEASASEPAAQEEGPVTQNSGVDRHVSEDEYFDAADD